MFLEMPPEPNQLSETAMQRLPSGRHRLTPDAVAASQQGRMLYAIMKSVAEKGYGATTVADVCELAGVSRRTFYEQFESKEECFLAAYDTGVEILLGRMAEATEALGESDWRAVTRSDLETYLKLLADEPEFAWSLHIEVLAAGPAALERRAAIFGIFTERTRRLYEVARREDPDLPELPDEVFRIHTGGMDELVRDHLRSRGAATLPELTDPAVAATVALFERG